MATEFDRLRGLYNQYQTAGNQQHTAFGQHGIRSSQMDLASGEGASGDVLYDPMGRAHYDENFMNDVSRDAEGYRDPGFDYYLSKGIVGEDDYDEYLAEMAQSNGNFYYEPGQRRTFGASGDGGGQQPAPGPLPPSPTQHGEYPTDLGESETTNQLNQLLAALTGMNSQPGATMPDFQMPNFDDLMGIGASSRTRPGYPNSGAAGNIDEQTVGNYGIRGTMPNGAVRGGGDFIDNVIMDDFGGARGNVGSDGMGQPTGRGGGGNMTPGGGDFIDNVIMDDFGRVGGNMAGDPSLSGRPSLTNPDPSLGTGVDDGLMYAGGTPYFDERAGGNSGGFWSGNPADLPEETRRTMESSQGAYTPGIAGGPAQNQEGGGGGTPYPVFAMPGEDLGPAIDDTYLDIMEGQDPLNMGGRWQDFLNSMRNSPDLTDDMMGEGDGADPLQGLINSLLGDTEIDPQNDDVRHQLMTLIGEDDLGMETRLNEYLDRTRGGGVNSTRLQNRLESARENLTGGQTAALADMRGILADRGLASIEGKGSGSELESTLKVLEPLQRAYLGEVRDAEFNESTAADEAERDALGRGAQYSEQTGRRRLDTLGAVAGRDRDVFGRRQDAIGMASDRDLARSAGRRESLRDAGNYQNDRQAGMSDALSRASGVSRDIIDQRLAAANSAQDRERIMADIALGTLDRNMEWNQFLANFGLDRERLMNEIQQGRLSSIAPILQMFMSLTAQSRGGYIGQGDD